MVPPLTIMLLFELHREFHKKLGCILIVVSHLQKFQFHYLKTQMLKFEIYPQDFLDQPQFF